MEFKIRDKDKIIEELMKTIRDLKSTIVTLDDKNNYLTIKFGEEIEVERKRYELKMEEEKLKTKIQNVKDSANKIKKMQEKIYSFEGDLIEILDFCDGCLGIY